MHINGEGSGRPERCLPVLTHKKGEDNFDTLNAHFILAILHLNKKGVIQKIRRGPDMGCMCWHIKKGKNHFDTFNAHFIFAQFLQILHPSKKGRYRLI